MRIETVEIRNLRSIRELYFRFESLTALIGANNAGKSTILKAIELFFDSAPKVAQDDFCQFDPDHPIEITIGFICLTPEEFEILGSAAIDGKLNITRHFSMTEADSGQYSVRASVCRDFDAIRNETNGTAKRTAYNRLADETEGLERVSSHTEVEEVLKNWELDNPDKCEITKVRGFYGAINVANGKLRKKTSVHLVPAVRDVSEATSDTRKSPIISLLSDISRQTFENKKSYLEFVDRANKEFAELTDPATVPELAGISELLTESLQRFYADSKLQAHWEPGQGINLSFPTPSLIIENGGTTTDLTRVGHGLQIAALFSVVQFLAQQSSNNPTESGEEFDEPASDIILLVEEPEIYQHPSKQLVIFDAFKRIVQGFNKFTGIRIQLIYTTHSEKFVRMDNFEIARIVRKEDGETGMKTTASGLAVSACSAAIAALLEPPREPMSDEAFVAKLHIFTREVCEGFFASKIILVEGVTDKAVLEAIFTAQNRDVHQESISIISVEGKTKMDRPGYIFSQLGIPTYMIYDNDGKKTADKQKPATNILLQKICGVGEPELFPVGAYNRFAAFEDKLETYLKGRLGDEKYAAFFDQVSDEYDLNYDEIKKTPAALVKVIKAAYAEDIKFPLFDEIIEKFDAL